ncbi:peptide-methionine (S)-S-oxide reductase MsrA [Halocatena marina]|uniref:Peptide methionine sulfoxide reductase MsrA n=1 Tax=Halocatena marina TaxID=2934937 RepID=A0ABD5YR23_9EURY|nr:peptide-methionine (S)-S-oxide reductase MsrA [Halocatena marina]
MVFDYDKTVSERADTATATFALGCFWGPDARFGAMDGVIRTRVGYAGGTTESPSYHSLGDHTEVFQVDYDPNERSYRELLELVFAAHDPHQQPTKTQYQNVVFYTSDDERRVIESVLEERGQSIDDIATRIEPLDVFYAAEPYHQKYRLRNHRLAEQFADYDDEAFRESPAAATLNGFVADHIDSDDLGSNLRALLTDVEAA